jgi:hypothetical protein
LGAELLILFEWLDIACHQKEKTPDTKKKSSARPDFFVAQLQLFLCLFHFLYQSFLGIMASCGQFAAELIENARAIASAGKGILAADESTGTIGQRFTSIKVDNNEDNRRKYRQLLFTANGKTSPACVVVLHVLS